MFLKGLLIKEKMYFKNLNSVAKSTIFWQNRKQKSNVFSVLRCAEWKVIAFLAFCVTKSRDVSDTFIFYFERNSPKNER